MNEYEYNGYDVPEGADKIELMGELTDIIHRIQAFNRLHPEGVFLYNFLGYKKNNEECEDCGGPVQELDANKSIIGAFGDLETLRMASSMLRDLIEDYCDEDGWVSF